MRVGGLETWTVFMDVICVSSLILTYLNDTIALLYNQFIKRWHHGTSITHTIISFNVNVLKTFVHEEE